VADCDPLYSQACQQLKSIATRVRSLPEHLQREALHYVEYLLQRQDAARDGREWADACAVNLHAAYGDSDAVYDAE
jgi:hypothetical protein